MELNVASLIVAGFIGLLISAVWGFNLLAIVGALFLLALFSPFLALSFERDFVASQSISSTMGTSIVKILPSLVVGELAGIATSTIFKVIRGVF